MCRLLAYRNLIWIHWQGKFVTQIALISTLKLNGHSNLGSAVNLFFTIKMVFDLTNLIHSDQKAYLSKSQRFVFHLLDTIRPKSGYFDQNLEF